MATNTVTTSGLATIAPEIAPYYTGAGITGAGLLPKAQEIYAKDYASSMGDQLTASGLAGAGRVAGLAPMQQQIGTELAGMQTPGQFAQGTSGVQLGFDALGSMISPEQTQMYMSPYIQNVMDVNKAEAFRDAQKNLVGANLASSRQGSYGGARNALMQSEAERNLQTKLGGIQATGMQQAFEAAQKAQIAQAAGYGQLGQTLGALGTAQQASDIDRIKTQGAYGDLQRAVTQQGIDAQYQDLMRQISYPKEQLAGMQGILTGVPTASSATTQTTQTPSPSFASQLAGTGLTGLSLYNMFSGK
jgi:hypothetical protein